MKDSDRHVECKIVQTLSVISCDKGSFIDHGDSPESKLNFTNTSCMQHTHIGMQQCALSLHLCTIQNTPLGTNMLCEL